METTRFVHWQDGKMWLGYLEEYPVYLTQGETFDELKENLRDLYKDLTSGVIPCVRKIAPLTPSSGKGPMGTGCNRYAGWLGPRKNAA